MDAAKTIQKDDQTNMQDEYSEMSAQDLRRLLRIKDKQDSMISITSRPSQY